MTIEAKFIEIEVEAVDEIPQLPQGARGPGNFWSLLSPEDAGAFLDKCSNMPGVQWIAAPKVTTIDGRQARIFNHGNQDSRWASC